MLRDLVPFVQFKKCEKHPWRSVNFSKVAGFSLTSQISIVFFRYSSDILGKHLGSRKRRPNKREYSVLANNFIRYLRSSFSILISFSCIRDFQSVSIQHLLTSGINYFKNNIPEKSLKLIREENLNRIIIAH